MQSLLIIAVIFNFVLKTSCAAAATFFTQVTVHNDLIEFEMEYGGTYVEDFIQYPVEAASIVFSENENVKCFLRGFEYGSKGVVSTLSALFTYSSPLYIRRTWTIEHNQLVCYDISDNPNTAVLLLDSKAYATSPDALRKLPLNEDGEGVLLFPKDGQYFGLMSLIDSPYERLWCKAGYRYRDDEIIGYRGVKIASGKLSALPCTTRPRPAGDYGPPGILPGYNPNHRDFRALDAHFKELIKAERNKASDMNEK